MKSYHRILISISAVALVGLLCVAEVAAWPCTVTKTRGDRYVEGSLPSAVANSCNPIDFEWNVARILVSNPVSLKPGMIIQGGGKVTVEGDEAFESSLPIFQLGNTGSKLDGIRVKHPGGTAIAINGSGTTVQNCNIYDSDIGIKVVFGDKNLLSKNIFRNIDNMAIMLSGSVPGFAANGGIEAPAYFGAVMTDFDRWEISGSVDVGTQEIEFYLADSDNAIVPQGVRYIPASAVVSGGVFSATFLFDELHANVPLTMIAIDADGNTSEFSEVFNPIVDDADFFTAREAFSACDAEWFADADAGAWKGDYDGDGVANGDEDANRNCVVDGAETDPAKAPETIEDDFDEDGVRDGLDNCPVNPNADQSDIDDDDIGDVCDNCPAVDNFNQIDSDHNGVGDVCEPTPPSPSEDLPVDEVGSSGSGGCGIVGATSANAASVLIMMIAAFATVLGNRKRL